MSAGSALLSAAPVIPILALPVRAPLDGASGYGSGWQGSKKTTIEDSLCLSISSLVKKKALVAESWTRGSWQWSYEGSEPHARIGYEANLIDAEAAWIRLTYTASGNPMDYRVRLVTTQPTYGGRRWWFLLPVDAPGWRAASARGEALSAARREVFRKPPSLRAHLHVVPGEWEIRRRSIDGWLPIWWTDLSSIRLALKRL